MKILYDKQGRGWANGPGVRQSLMILGVSLWVFGCAGAHNAWAQMEDDVVEVETEIGLDQISERSSTRAISPDAELLPKAPQGMAESGQEDVQERKLDKLELKEEQLIKINKSLRNIIEENERLRTEQRNLESQLRNLRGQRAIELNQLNTLRVERDVYKKQSDDVQAVKDRILEYAEQKESEMHQREKFLAERIKRLEKELRDINEEQEVNRTVALVKKKYGVTDTNAKSLELVEMLDDLNNAQDTLRRDEAKVHYNMGNTFFAKGQYRKAAGEFREAVRLAPEDAFAHFNLAFVSSEYMYDFKTSLKHFKEYLVLNPQAKDAALVQEKILEAELKLNSQIDSKLEQDLQDDQSNMYRH